MNHYPQRPGEAENCRDFLRTGRCKYGEACKYHHPPNVQNGGGVRSPLNPGEPPFPIRRGEPACQYYLKHGTCKFGQTCKFNHPPMSPKQTAAFAVQSSGTTYVLANDHVLPQRPTEPDCIYFLRNGRCKYGSSCKYHHPLTAEDKNERERSRSTGSILDVSGSSHISFGTLNGATAIPVHIVGSNGISHGQTHIILNDGKLALMLNPTNAETVSTASTGHMSSSYPSASTSHFYNNPHPASTGTFGHSQGFSLSSYEANDNQGRSILGQYPSHVTSETIHGSNVTGSPALSSLTPHQSASQGSLSLNDYTSSAPMLSESPPRTSSMHESFEHKESSNLTPQTTNYLPSTPSTDPPRMWGTDSALSPSARSWEMPSSSALSQPMLGRRDEFHSPDRETNRFRHESRLFPKLSSAQPPRRTTSDRTSEVTWSSLGRHEAFETSGRREKPEQSRLGGYSASMHAHKEEVENSWDDGLSNMTSALLSIIDTPDPDQIVPSSSPASASDATYIASPSRRTMTSDHQELSDYSRGSQAKSWSHSSSYS